jgi:hypothetical protein
MSLELFPGTDSPAENALSLLVIVAGLALLTSTIADFFHIQSFVLPGYAEEFVLPIIFILGGFVKILKD